MPRKARPTIDTFGTLQDAYDYFNKYLWGGKLPQCMILVHRKAGAHGYYWPQQFEGPSGKKIDEIALSPSSMSRTDREVLSTLVHEMAHLWQEHFGKPSRGAYHNSEWADEMERIGLMPSDSGKPGGARTGQHMTHYIIRGGMYAKAFTKWRKLRRSLKYSGQEELVTAEKLAKRKSKTKYTCPDCGQNAWAKPAAKLDCGDCGYEMEAEDD